MEIKPTLRSYLTLLECLRIETQVTVHAGEDVDLGEGSTIAGGSANLYNYYINPYGNSSENWKLL